MSKLLDDITAALAPEPDSTKSDADETREDRAASHDVLSAKPDGHDSPPKGYPKDSSSYADEVNLKYPLDTEEHVRAALSYWGMPKNREGYNADEQAHITARIESAARKFGIDQSDDKKSGPEPDITKDKNVENDTPADVSGQNAEPVAKMKTISVTDEVQDSKRSDHLWDIFCGFTSALEQAYGVGDELGQEPTMDFLSGLVDEMSGLIKQCLSTAPDADGDQAAMPTMVTYALDQIAITTKAGARHSKADASHIQTIHDHAVQAGAECAPDTDAGDDNMDGKNADTADVTQKTNEPTTEHKNSEKVAKRLTKSGVPAGTYHWDGEHFVPATPPDATKADGEDVVTKTDSDGIVNKAGDADRGADVQDGQNADLTQKHADENETVKALRAELESLKAQVSTPVDPRSDASRVPVEFALKSDRDALGGVHHKSWTEKTDAELLAEMRGEPA